MDKSSRIYVAGHTGMVGSAIVRALKARGYENLLLMNRGELDLRGHRPVADYFRATRPEYVFMAAARVGGIQANISQPAEFIMDNMLMQASVIQAAYLTAAFRPVKKLLFLGSSCMYPRDCPQPMREDMLLSGPPEPTNRAYAIAKIAGMEMCRAYRQQYGCNFITAIPCNVYGPGDHYEPERAHVIPTLISRMAARVEALAIDVWGTGTPRREFMHVDDLAAACLFLMENHDSPEPINAGTGQDIQIAELAYLIARVADYRAMVRFRTSEPDGAPQKLLDVSRINALGWKAKIGLEEGLRRTIEEYKGRR